MVPQLHSSDKVVDVHAVAVHRRGGRPCAHAGTWFAVLEKVVCMPVASNDRCLRLTGQKTVEFPQWHVDVCWCSSSMVVEVPVLMQRRGTGPSCCNDSYFWSRQCRTLSGGFQVQFFFTETGLAVQTVQKTGDSVVQFGWSLTCPLV